MSVIQTCDCGESIAIALGGGMDREGSVGSTPTSPIVHCLWCGGRSVEPELADVASLRGVVGRN